jgi:hypothetical protein
MDGTQMKKELMAAHIAAGAYYGYAKTHGNKVKYGSEHGARYAARNMMASGKARHPLEAYPCAFCEYWHIGREMTEDELKQFMGSGAMILDYDEPTAQWLTETMRFAASLWQGDTTNPEEQLTHLVKFHQFNWLRSEPELPSPVVYRQLMLQDGHCIKVSIWRVQGQGWKLRIVQENPDECKKRP